TNPEGIWYTSVTGIWQTVWLEPVPASSLAGLKLVPDVDAGLVRVTAQGRGTQGTEGVRVLVKEGGRTGAESQGRVDQPIAIKLPNARLWSPASPFLYDLTITLERDGKSLDEVASYFAMRKISAGKDKAGFNRLLLNNQPLFQLGPLDQGWWPDGLYT